MERKKLEKKIIRMLRLHVRGDMKDKLDLNTRIIMDLSLDSMDFMVLTDEVEKDFGIHPSMIAWNNFWDNGEVTVKQLCDFVEGHLYNNIHKRSGGPKDGKENG